MDYKIFGNTGLRVSELALGTMTFGTEWGWGIDKKQASKLFEIYTEAGGNFIDTANHYTDGTSEKFVGEFIASDRDHFVLGTKYTLYDKARDVNFAGNHRKNLYRSVKESLNRLKTDYLDILWVHAWDFLTPVEEVLRGLTDLVRSGQVHYVAISDTPAWIIAQANTLADAKGYVPFSAIQVEYNLLERTSERELIPMAEAFGLAVTNWSPLSSGLLTGKYLEGGTGRLKQDDPKINERNTKIVQVVVDIAKESGASPAQVALAWIRAQSPANIPIIGGTRPEHLKDNLACINLSLSEKFLDRLARASAIDLGFPHDFLGKDGVKDRILSEERNRILRK